MAFRFPVELAFPTFEFPLRPAVAPLDVRIAEVSPDVREELIRRGRALERQEWQRSEVSRLRRELMQAEYAINNHRAEQEARRPNVRQAVHGYSPCCTPERGAFDTEREFREAHARAQDVMALHLAAQNSAIAVNRLPWNEVAAPTTVFDAMKAEIEKLPPAPAEVVAAVEAALSQKGIGYFTVDFGRVEANAETVSEPEPELVEA